MMDRPRSDPGASGALGKLAGFVITVVVLAGIYVAIRPCRCSSRPTPTRPALLATVADTVDADGVLLFDEVYVPGGGTLGYLAADGERVSAGAAVAEIYSSPEQAGLRQQLTSLNDQIELLQRSQNTTATQLDSLKKERASALYDMMDALDSSAYDETARAKKTTSSLRTSSGSSPVKSRTSRPRSPPSPSSRRRCRPSWGGRPRSPPSDGLLHPQLCQRAAQRRGRRHPRAEHHRPAGVSEPLPPNCRWTAARARSSRALRGGTSASVRPRKGEAAGRQRQAPDPLGEDKFPGQMETPLKASVSEVAIDEATGLARFVITCEIINGDVLRLNRASARSSWARPPACAFPSTRSII